MGYLYANGDVRAKSSEKSRQVAARYALDTTRRPGAGRAGDNTAGGDGGRRAANGNCVSYIFQVHHFAKMSSYS